MDPIAQIKADHREVEMLFAEYARRRAQGDARTEAIAFDVLEALTIHAELEEKLIYPELKKVLTEPLQVLEAIEEHHVATMLIKELQAMTFADERFEAKMAVLETLVQQHVLEEEEIILPLAEEKLERDQRADLGRQYADAKERLQQQAMNLNVTLIREFPVEQPKER